MVNEKHLAVLNLLRESSGPVSGETLASSLGVSRVALWKRIEVLRAAGYRISSQAKGYVFEDHDLPLPWEFPGDEAHVHHFTTLESTMDEAFRRGWEGDDQALVISEAQTAGRGRLGRPWSTMPGSLSATAVVRAAVPLAYIGALCLEAVCAMVETVREEYGVTLDPSWPNDLSHEGRKVGGVLVEAWGPADSPRFYTVGMGLNVHAAPRSTRPTASLVDLGVVSPDRRRLLRGWQRRLRSWAASPAFEPGRWTLGAQMGRTVRAATFEGREVRGRVEGVDRRGALKLLTGTTVSLLEYGTTQWVKGDLE